MTMRLSGFVVAASLLSAPVAAQQPAAPPNPLIVKVGVMTLRPDGAPGGYAVETGEKENETFGGGVLTDGCRMGAGDNWVGGAAIPSWGLDAWEIRGKVISLGPDQAVVQLDWRRARFAGQPVDDAMHSTQLTLAVDQMVTLDTAGPGRDCEPRSMVFGARYARKFSTAPSAPSGRSTPSAGATAGAAPQDAELWLVHRVPGQPETALPLVTRIGAAPTTFRFPLINVPVAGGVLQVQVTGRMSLMGGSLMYWFDRATTFAPSNRPPRDTSAEVDRGNTGGARPLPGPNDVIEYEMPALQLQGMPAVPDTFAVRLRIRSAK